MTQFWCTNLDDLANCLAWFNAVINPFLYAFVGKKFRQNLFEMVRSWSGKKENSAPVFNDSEIQSGVTKVTVVAI